MILAYHRVSSNEVLGAIMEAGRIIPAAYRLDPERIRGLCGEMLRDASSPAADGVMELVDEAAAYFQSVQEASIGHKTWETALRCEDILSGDSGRVFLSPEGWSEAGRGLGWPLSGFVFDAEQLIRMGARFRRRDLGSSFWVLFRHTMEQATSPEDAKERILEGIREILEKGEVGGEEALEAIQVFHLDSGDEKLRPHERRPWQQGAPRGSEIIWDGPLPLDLAGEIWRDENIVWSAMSETRAL